MITDRGIWTSRAETDTHLFDEPLCNAIIEGLSHDLTVVDLGCGNGAYTMAIRNAGFLCIGYDGSPLTEELTGGICRILDMSEPAYIGRYDIVLSLEVGEHIPSKYEDIFIRNLDNACRKVIILSWAIEGQPGTGHVNCRNNDYIIKKFEDRGFIYCEDSAKDLRDKSTLPWFKDTLLVFSR